MILACPACDSRYDVTGHDVGQKFRCRCGEVVTLKANMQAGMLACPHCGAGVATSAKTCDHCSSHLLLKACPRCLSRVFHGHKHCPDCGAELGVAAISDVNPERACPRCPNPLHARRIGDIVIDECATCHGIFLDHVAVQRVVTDRQQSRADAILGMLPPSETQQTIPAGGKMYVKCPVCTTMMNRKLFSAGSGVIIDVCRAHGAFFDVGELPKIISFVMNGGLEQAQKKEISRMRDEAKREKQDAQFASMMATRSSSGDQLGFAATHTAGGAFVDLLFALWR
ncbi:MAG: zf-TFIIB domain-containing protein [Deltaproteobacteria bacterium]|nr:zf-TFIIB domain-containing protein [Deltaproteobacteria bacterium]